MVDDIHGATEFDVSDIERLARAPLSRRVFIQGSVAGAALTGIGLLAADPVFADPLPTSAAAMASLALSEVGKTLAQLQSSDMRLSPWGTFQGDWCSVFAAWLTRAVIATPFPGWTFASSLYASAPSVSTPQVGDFIHYVNSKTSGHIGVVVAINANGSPQTVEGNTHTHPWRSAIVSHYTTPWGGGVTYSRPPWAASGGPMNSTGEDMTDVIYYADSTLGANYSSGSINVVGESMWYQECPGAPLFPLSGGVAYTATAAIYEYGAFASTRSTNVNAERYPLSCANIGALIALRGQTTKPIGNF